MRPFCAARCPLLLLAVCGSLIVLSAQSGGAGPAEDSDKFFKSDKVVQLSIELGAKELQALRSQPRTYTKATLKEGDKVISRDVGVHLKGAAGSYRNIDDKPNL